MISANVPGKKFQFQLESFQEHKIQIQIQEIFYLKNTQCGIDMLAGIIVIHSPTKFKLMQIPKVLLN